MKNLISFFFAMTFFATIGFCSTPNLSATSSLNEFSKMSSTIEQSVNVQVVEKSVSDLGCITAVITCECGIEITATICGCSTISCVWEVAEILCERYCPTPIGEEPIFV